MLTTRDPALELDKIDNQRGKYAEVKGDPEPDTRFHGAVAFHSQCTLAWIGKRISD